MSGTDRSGADLFSRIEPHLSSVEKPSRYLDHEFGVRKNEGADYRIVFLYPDTYEIGQSNQGLAILYHMVNDDPTLSAERVYVPWDDMAAIMRGEDIPLFSLETCTPVRDFDAVGITIPYELCSTNILEALDLAGIPLFSSERSEDCPLVIAGGPCTYEPEPYAPFIDLFSIGEGEYSIPEFCRMHRALKAAGLSRAEVLHRLATDLPGAYVPACYEQVGTAIRPLFSDVPPVVKKRVVADFEGSPTGRVQIVPFSEVTHDHYNVEVLRGCARGCRFCQAGMIYRPVRERSADQIVDAALSGLACTGYDEVSLASLSTTDHSCLPEVLSRLNERLSGTGTSVSIPSQRVDAFGVEMARLVAGTKKGGLTLAPEAGSQRLRDIINKNVTEDDLMEAIRAGFMAGWRRCKLYFMCGLPGETDEDLRAIGKLVEHASETARGCVPADQRGNVRLSVSCALFIPKPDTPFQWCGQVPRGEIERRVSIIRESMPRRGVDFKWHDPEGSYLEAALARGGREMADVIYGAWKRGARFDAWSDRFKLERWTEAAAEAGVDLDAEACTAFPLDGDLPWSHISCGVSTGYLRREYERALEGKTTPDCTFSGCTGCSVCQELDCGNVIVCSRGADRPAPSQQEAQEQPDKDVASESRFRLRMWYSKTGRLAYLSHLEVLATVERIVRRAGLPFAVTQGFNPHMKTAFGPALGCGTAGLEEYADLFLTRYVEPDEALARLKAAGADGLMPQRVWYVGMREPSLSVHLNAFEYEVVLAPAAGDTASSLEGALSAVLAEGTVEAVRKKGRKAISLPEMLLSTPTLETLPSDSGDPAGTPISGTPSPDGGKHPGQLFLLTLRVRNGERGTMRPEIFVAAMGKHLDQAPHIVRMTRVAQFHEEGGMYRKPLDSAPS